MSETIYKPGDIFTFLQGSTLLVIKVIAVDMATETYHVRLWEGPNSGSTTLQDLSTLPILALHGPFSFSAFPYDASSLIGQTAVTDEDKTGYIAYLHHTNFPAYVAESGIDVTTLIGEAKSHYEAGIAHSDAGAFMEAIAAYDKALATFPLFYEALDNRALIKMDQSDWGNAAADFKTSLKIEPNNPLAWYNLGFCQHKLGDITAAKISLEQCLSLEPNHMKAQTLLASLAV